MRVGTEPARSASQVCGYGSRGALKAPLGEVGARSGSRQGRIAPARGPRCAGADPARYGRLTLPSASSTTRPSRSSDSTASRSSSSRAPALRATSRSVSARRWRNEPSNRLCLRSGLVARAARGAAPRERAGAAARDAREAERRAEIHQRLRRRAGEAVAGAALDAVDVDVVGEHVLAEREVADRRRGVRADARAAASGRPASPRARSPAPRGAARARAGCTRAPARRGSRPPAGARRAPPAVGQRSSQSR